MSKAAGSCTSAWPSRPSTRRIQIKPYCTGGGVPGATPMAGVRKPLSATPLEPVRRARAIRPSAPQPSPCTRPTARPRERARLSTTRAATRYSAPRPAPCHRRCADTRRSARRLPSHTLAVPLAAAHRFGPSVFLHFSGVQPRGATLGHHPSSRLCRGPGTPATSGAGVRAPRRRARSPRRSSASPR